MWCGFADEGSAGEGQGGRLEDDWKPGEGDQRTADEIEEETRKTEAANRAVVLEMIGDLPEAEAKPPSNMLFICKLNPVTTEEVRSHSYLVARLCHPLHRLTFILFL